MTGFHAALPGTLLMHGIQLLRGFLCLFVFNKFRSNCRYERHFCLLSFSSGHCVVDVTGLSTAQLAFHTACICVPFPFVLRQPSAFPWSLTWSFRIKYRKSGGYFLCACCLCQCWWQFSEVSASGVGKGGCCCQWEDSQDCNTWWGKLPFGGLMEVEKVKKKKKKNSN